MKFPLTNNKSLLKASHIIDSLVKSGVQQFFISPGMRNAPLIAAIEAHPDTKIELGMDERAHSFKALGFTKFSGQLSCLLCTSGTALANYYPAVIEAYKSETPLLILSADRPYEKILGGDNQTIEQAGIYHDYVLKSYELTDSFSLLRESVYEGVQLSQNQNGPVHFNVPLTEPLDSTVENYLINPEMNLFEDSPKFLSIQREVIIPDALVENFNDSKTPLIVIGELFYREAKDHLISFLNEHKGLKYIDVSSGLKYDYNLEYGSLPALDHPEVLRYLKDINPDFVLHLGGRIISKHYYNFLKELETPFIYQVNSYKFKTDPSFKMTEIKASVNDFIKGLTPKKENNLIRWEEVHSFVEKKREIIENSPLTFPLISKRLIEMAPKNMIFYLGNSTSIRSFDSYSGANVVEQIRVLCHRGVSGIEGFIAASSSVHNPVTLILGDVSFFHDLNSLYYLKDHQAPYVCILINDQGGGIFEQLPIARDKKTLPYLTSPHELHFSQFCEGMGVHHQFIRSIDELQEHYLKAVQENRASVLEVLVSREDNKEVYQRLKTIRL